MIAKDGSMSLSRCEIPNHGIGLVDSIVTSRIFVAAIRVKLQN